jgi:hypothetical protein
MRPIVTYTKPTSQEVDAFRQTIKEYEPQDQRPDEFLPSSMPGFVSPRVKAVKPKWEATPSMRPDGWLGIRDHSKQRRSWTMKRVITVNLEQDDEE